MITNSYIIYFFKSMQKMTYGFNLYNLNIYYIFVVCFMVFKLTLNGNVGYGMQIDGTGLRCYPRWPECSDAITQRD